MDAKAYDYSPLSRKYPYRQIWSYVQQRGFASSVVLTILALMLLIAASAGTAVFIYAPIHAGILPGASPIIHALVGSTIFFVILSAFTWITRDALLGTIVSEMRYADFAQANGLKQLDAKDPQPGMIFQKGHSRMFMPGFEFSGTPSGTQIGNYRYTVGSGKSSRTYFFGVIRVSLSRNLPHVLLDTTSNNFMKRFSNLGSFGDEQHIKLEGNFNDYFRVYTPENYGRDTLYWLTPELMSILIQHFTAYDLEIVDNHVYLYSSATFTMNGKVLPQLIQSADWLYHEFEQNTRRYSDERVGSFAANTIATPGRRLKQRLSAWVFIGLIIYMVIRVAAVIWS